MICGYDFFLEQEDHGFSFWKTASCAQPWVSQPRHSRQLQALSCVSPVLEGVCQHPWPLPIGARSAPHRGWQPQSLWSAPNVPWGKTTPGWRTTDLEKRVRKNLAVNTFYLSFLMRRNWDIMSKAPFDSSCVLFPRMMVTLIQARICRLSCGPEDSVGRTAHSCPAVFPRCWEDVLLITLAVGHRCLGRGLGCTWVSCSLQFCLFKLCITQAETMAMNGF